MALNTGLILFSNLATNANDDTGGGLNGTASNVSFSSNRANWSSGGYINYGNLSQLNFERTDPFSFSMVVNISSFTTNFMMFLSKMKTSGGAEGYSINTGNSSNNTKLEFFIRNTSGNSFGALTNMTFSTSTDYHIVVTYDGSSAYSGIKIYVNGTQVSTTNTGSSSITGTIQNSNPFNLGNRDNNSEANPNYYFHGYQQKFGAWQRELTSADVTELWNNGNPLPYPFATGGGGHDAVLLESSVGITSKVITG